MQEMHYFQNSCDIDMSILMCISGKLFKINPNESLEIIVEWICANINIQNISSRIGGSYRNPGPEIVMKTIE